MNEEQKAIRKAKIMIISVFILVVASIALISYNYVLSKIHLTFETINLEEYGNMEPKNIEKNTKEEKEIIEENKQEETPNKSNNINTTKNINSSLSSDYIGYLEIPKINLKQHLVDLNSKQNNVNKNIQTIYPSTYPDQKNSNLILASHSGNSSISYFKNLYKINKNDQAYVLYKNSKYIYNIVNIYTVPKNGEVEIYYEENKTILTLITCTKNDDTTQTVYIGELIRKEGIK